MANNGRGGHTHGTYYRWQRLDRKGKRVRVPKNGWSARTAAVAYAGRHKFKIKTWTASDGKLIVERVS